ncbi:MAG: histidinol-phosphate transaminase, partial [Chrysiogenetes bacterium]|nr:histidinol-phosphate transaminase [Chrysiogenetes bacterium]
MSKVRQNIETLAPYVPGKPVEELERELGITDIIKLASNENPLGPSPMALAAAHEAVGQINLYPDGSGHDLVQAIAKRHGVAPEQVVLGNGSNDVLEVAARTFLAPGDEVVFSQYAFVVYRLVSQAIGASMVEVPARADLSHDLDAIAAAITDKTRVVFLANPNNPTGTMFSAEEWEKFLARVPEHVLLVVDEAYAEYVGDETYPDHWKALKAGRDVLITRTFSKIFGIAGLRVGYGVTSAGNANYMNRVRQPFNTNLVAQAAARAALEDHEFVRRSREVNARGIHYLRAHLEKRGLKVTPSWGNFVLVDLG